MVGIGMLLTRSHLIARSDGIVWVIAYRQVADDHVAFFKHLRTNGISLVLLRSSMVMSGRGTAVVTAVGDETEIGKVSHKSTELTFTKTPLSIQLSMLAKMISKIGVTVAVLAFVVFLVHDILVNPIWQTNHYLDMFEVVLRYFMFSVTMILTKSSSSTWLGRICMFIRLTRLSWMWVAVMLFLVPIIRLPGRFSMKFTSAMAYRPVWA